MTAPPSTQILARLFLQLWVDRGRMPDQAIVDCMTAEVDQTIAQAVQAERERIILLIETGEKFNPFTGHKRRMTHEEIVKHLREDAALCARPTTQELPHV